MKATVDSSAFFKALNRVIPLLKVSAIPALSEASIQFRDGVCTITATDLELWIQMMWHWYCPSDTVPPHEQIMKGIDEHENHLYPQG